MSFKVSKSTLLIGICAAALCAGALFSLEAQAPAAPGKQAAPGGRGGGGGGRGGSAAGVFTAVDVNKDGSVTREEMKAAFAKWLSDGDAAKTGSVTQEQLAAALNAAMPQPAAPAGGRGAAPQNQTPNPADVEKMMAALPDKAPAKPKKPRKVLVLGKANGFVHSCIPLAAKTVEAIGVKTGAWSTTTTYDPADIARAGVFVSIDAEGALSVDRGYVRPDDEAPVGEPEQDGDKAAVDVVGVLGGKFSEEFALGAFIRGLEAAQEFIEGVEDLFGEDFRDTGLVVAAALKQCWQAGIAWRGEQRPGAEEELERSENEPAGDFGHRAHGEGKRAGVLLGRCVDEAEVRAVGEQADRHAGLAQEPLEFPRR